MTAAREVLPNRRAAETFLDRGERPCLHMHVGRFADGRIAEIFLQNPQEQLSSRHRCA